MDYKEKYEKLEKFIKDLYPFMSDYYKEKTEGMIPELKESNDELIIKDIISYLKYKHSDPDVAYRKYDKWIAWLEKQGKETSWNPSYEDIFPNTEDGVRRRSTIQVLEYARSLDAYNQYGKESIDKDIAWLEKQGESKEKPTKRQVWDYCNKISHEWWQITMDKWNTLTDEDKNKYNQFIGFNDFSDTLMNITAGALFQLIDTGKLEYEEGSLLLEKPDDTPKHVEFMTVPEKSQREQKPTCLSDNLVHNVKFAFPFKAKVKSNGKIVTILNGQLSMDCKEWIKYQSDVEDGYTVYAPEELVNIEQKPADKVKPKFKVGDWVVENITNGIFVGKITSINTYFYGVDGLDGNWYHIDLFEEQQMHLWTIEDAKDGDILSKDSIPFIFKSRDNNCIAYCGITDFGLFKVVEDGFSWCNDINVTPATKKQRGLLFQKMKEAGYGWDAEKKELKEIEPKLTEFEKEVAEAYEWAKTTEREDFVNEFAPKFLDLARKEIEKLLNRK